MKRGTPTTEIAQVEVVQRVDGKVARYSIRSYQATYLAHDVLSMKASTNYAADETVTYTEYAVFRQTSKDGVFGKWVLKHDGLPEFDVDAWMQNIKRKYKTVARIA